MREVAKLTAFILLIIGTIGLLVNEFVADWGRVGTIVFAVFNFIYRVGYSSYNISEDEA